MMKSNHRWNQGDVTELPFTMQREHASHRIEIDASAEDVFEQIRTSDGPPWLPPGAMRLPCKGEEDDEAVALWSDTETAGMLFGKPGVETFWTTSLVDVDEYRLHVALINPELAAGILDVNLTDRGETTAVRLTLSYTVLSKAGSKLFDSGINERLNAFVTELGSTLAALCVRDSAKRETATSSEPRRCRAARYETTIAGDIDECFSLACPVAELRWIDGWKFDLIYSESGKNETGCVFLEPGSGLSMLSAPGAKTYWLTTRFDTKKHLFDAIWITRDLTIAHWNVRMTDLGNGQNRVTWRLVYTGLGPRGDRLLSDPDLKKRMKRGLGFLATALKHYVETGTLFRLSVWRKLRLAVSILRGSISRRWLSSARSTKTSAPRSHTRN